MTVPAPTFEVLLHALATAGFDVRAELPRQRRPSVPVSVYAGAWRAALRRGLSPTHVLTMARSYLVGALAPFDIHGFSEATAAAALERLAEHWREIGGPGELLEVSRRGGTVHARWHRARHDVVERLDGLFAMATVFDRLRAHASRPLRALRVDVALVLDERERDAVAKFFGGPVQAGSRDDAFALAKDDAAVRLRTANPTVTRRLADVGRAPSLEERVCNAVRATLRLGSPLEEVAARLGETPRTLQRRLADSGLGYRALLEGTRAVEARALLVSGRATIAETATHLGFRDAATFTRAFRRWHGTPPAAYRSLVRGGSGRRRS